MKFNVNKTIALLVISGVFYSCSLENLTYDTESDVKDTTITFNTVKPEDMVVKSTDEFLTPINKINGNFITYYRGWKVSETVSSKVDNGTLIIQNLSPRSFFTNIDMTVDKTKLKLDHAICPFRTYEISPPASATLKTAKVNFSQKDQVELDSLKKLQWEITGIENHPKGSDDAKFEYPINAVQARGYASLMYNYALLFASDGLKKKLKEAQRTVFSDSDCQAGNCSILGSTHLVVVNGNRYDRGDVLSEADYKTVLKEKMIISKDKHGTEFRNITAEEIASKKNDNIRRFRSLNIGLVDNIKDYTMRDGSTVKGQELLDPELVYKKFIEKKEISLRLFKSKSDAGLGGGEVVSVNFTVMKDWENNQLRYYKGDAKGFERRIFQIFFHEMAHAVGYGHSGGSTLVRPKLDKLGFDHIFNNYARKVFVEDKTMRFYPYNQAGATASMLIYVLTQFRIARALSKRPNDPLPRDMLRMMKQPFMLECHSY